MKMVGVDSIPRRVPAATSAAMRVHRGGIVEARPERGDVEPDVARVAKEAVAVERLLMLEEHVVVFPEAPEPAGALGGGRRQARVRVQLHLHARIAPAVERKVAEDELHVGARPDELAQVAERVAAGGTLEVRELDDRDRRVGTPLHVRGRAERLGGR